MPIVGDVIAGKYEITDLIGEGGMGSVYKAHHKLTGKKVAMKWMLPELAKNEDAVQRFLREAQAAGRIDHKNVVDIYDVGQEDGAYFLVMEYLIGEPLTDALERGGMSVADVIDCLIPAMRGVAAAHAKGVVHRDLKPDNIFLCRSEDGGWREPKVLDFGISKISEGEGSLNPRLTATGAVMGTPYYMSPEQIRGSHAVDRRTDVYAFGVILYEALCGVVPFSAETYSALILEIATGTLRKPRDVNPELPQAIEEIVLKSMCREPEERYQDIDSFAYALEMYGNHAQFSSMRPDPTGAHSVGGMPAARAQGAGANVAVPATGQQVAASGSGQQHQPTPASGSQGAYGSGAQAQETPGSGSNTSTPFTADRATEAPLTIKKSNTGAIIGGAVAVAAAVGLFIAMSGGEPEAAGADNVVKPQDEAPKAAAAPVIPEEDLKPPAEDPAPVVEEIPQGKVVEAAPAPAPKPSASASASKSKERQRQRQRQERQRKKRAAEAKAAAARAAASSKPAASKPAAKRRRPAGRTGALNAADF